MREQESILIKISISAFATTLLIYEFIISSIVSISIGNIAEALTSLIASTGIFSLIFVGLIKLYDILFIKIFSPEFDLTGNWYHLTVVEEPKKDVRYGPIKIKNHLYSVNLTGNNIKFPREYRSRLISEMARFDGNELLIQYESKGAARKKNPVRNGFMSLVITPGRSFTRKTNMMSGYWADNLPSPWSGSIRIYRNKKERDKELFMELLDIHSDRILAEDKKVVKEEIKKGIDLDDFEKVFKEAVKKFEHSH